jgi:hypothetical protein
MRVKTKVAVYARRCSDLQGRNSVQKRIEICRAVAGQRDRIAGE